MVYLSSMKPLHGDGLGFYMMLDLIYAWWWRYLEDDEGLAVIGEEDLFLDIVFREDYLRVRDFHFLFLIFPSQFYIAFLALINYFPNNL